MDRFTVPTEYWHPLDDGRLQCDLCPRDCRLRDGQRASRLRPAREGDRVVLTTYGRSSGFFVDPIEKKPLNHFLPGSSGLLFGTAGCEPFVPVPPELGYLEVERSRTSDEASPETIARSAGQSAAAAWRSPTTIRRSSWSTRSTSRMRVAARGRVGRGHRRVHDRATRPVLSPPRRRQCRPERVHRGLLQARLRREPGAVLDTSSTSPTPVWVELTTVLIPGMNDTDEELDAMTSGSSNTSVPTCRCTSPRSIRYRMLDSGPTPPATVRARGDRDGQRRPLRVHGQRARPRRRQHPLSRVRRRGDPARRL